MKKHMFSHSRSLTITATKIITKPTIATKIITKPTITTKIIAKPTIARTTTKIKRKTFT
jgi:hypothetical protein